MRQVFPGAAISSQIEILGINFKVNGTRQRTLPHKALEKARRRMKRIRVVGRNLRDRRIITRTCMISMFSWAAWWSDMEKGCQKEYHSLVEKAVMNGMLQGRQRVVKESVLGKKRIASLSR